MTRRPALIALAVVAVDQATKALVRSQVAEGSVRQVLPGIDLVHTRNSGVSFGFLGDAPTWVVAAVSILALALVVTVVSRLVPARIGMAALTLIVAGAIGNLIDRVALGSVTDFLDLPLIPPCNVADVAISAGAVLLAAAVLMGGRDPQDTPTEAEQAA